MIRNYGTATFRAIGLTLIAIGAIILFRMISTDVYANISQQQLEREWNASESDDAADSVFSNLALAWFPATQAAINSLSGENFDSPAIDNPNLLFEKPSKSGDNGRNRVRHDEIPYKQPFAKIIIPRIKLKSIVVQGVDVEALKLGPGHMEETAYPGEVGNMVISGHRVTYCHPFYYLDQVKIGDPIIISTKKQVFVYNVVEKRVVLPTDVSVIQPTENRTLTLTTCNPRYSARSRLVVIAKMKDK